MATLRDATLSPKGYQKISSLNTVKTITAASSLATSRALIKVEGQSVRWRDDGVDPTTTDGMLIDVGDEFWYTGQVRALRFIETAASAVLHVNLYA